MIRSRLVGLFFPVAMLVALAGCSHGDRPRLAPVSGKVSLDGNPVCPGIIIFQPEVGRASMGRIEPDGTYELVYLRDISGAILGPHTVRVSDGAENPRASQIPARYNAETTLTATVKSGSNTFDFALDSDL